MHPIRFPRLFAPQLEYFDSPLLKPLRVPLLFDVTELRLKLHVLLFAESLRELALRQPHAASNPPNLFPGPRRRPVEVIPVDKVRENFLVDDLFALAGWLDYLPKLVSNRRDVEFLDLRLVSKPNLPQPGDEAVLHGLLERRMVARPVGLEVKRKHALQNQRSSPRNVIFRVVVLPRDLGAGRCSVERSLQNLDVRPENVVLSLGSHVRRLHAVASIVQVPVNDLAGTPPPLGVILFVCGVKFIDPPLGRILGWGAHSLMLRFGPVSQMSFNAKP